MRRIALLLGAFAALSALPAGAQAQAPGFGPVTIAGRIPISGPTAAAVTSDGRAAAAIAATFARSIDDTRVVLVSRGTGGWREQDVSGTTRFARDAQVAVNRHGTVVAAWAQYTRRRGNELVVAAGPAGGRVRVIARRRVASAASAMPRLAALTTERILLAWRDGTTLRAAAVGGDRLGRAHAVASRAGTLALAPLRSTVALAWLDSYVGRRARVLRSVQLQSEGAPVGRPLIVSRAASGAIRVAGSNEPRAIVSWLRPGGPARAYTRQVAPFTRPARPVNPGQIALGAPAIDLADDASAALTMRVSAFGIPSFGIVAANSQSGGVWTRMLPLTFGSPMIGSPQAVALGDRRSLVIFADARAPHPEVPAPIYDVRVGERDATGRLIGGQVLPTPYDHNDGDGVAVAHAGSRTVIAYAAPTGGLAVAERTG